MSKLYAENMSIESACGIGHVYGYSIGRTSWGWGLSLDELKNDGGADWVLAAFTPNEVCEKTYKALCAKHRLVFQSPVRENKNSGNRFFFCIFDTEGTMPYVDDENDDEDDL